MLDKNRYATTTPDRAVWIDDPGEFMASVPAILGFVPHRSLVVALLGLEPNRRIAAINAVIRSDLHDPQDMADAVATAAATNSADAVLVFVIDDRQPPLHPYDAVVIAVHDRLAESGIEVKGAWTVHRIAAGQRWHSLRPPHRAGRLPDPSTTVTAVDRVYRGGSVAPDRRTLKDLFTPLPALGKQISEHLPDAETRLHQGDAGARTRLRIRTMLHNVATANASGKPGPRALAEIAVAWRDTPVRDAALALAGTVHSNAAEQVALTLTRTQTGQDRARAAAVLAFLTYHRGEGTLAGMALEAALTADPYNSLAALLRTALDCALPADQLHFLAQHARDALATAGVEISPVALPDLL
ncbi:DUF4192 domain-containing protein [Nocardia fusca]|uniref:DUF4192 domain-containing protein n=1 Tax=Nocardia fusca TaxID=941183 RepID=UPI0007A75125|nr:DUF4192 domain-containing protein [Nocardia fusca]